MTTGGEGGMLLFRDEAAWRRAWEFKDHGKSYALAHADHHQPGFRWLHESIETNWRLTEMQAAIGLRQLAKLESWVVRRRALAHRLAGRLTKLPALRVPQRAADVDHAHYRLYAYVCPATLAPGWHRIGSPKRSQRNAYHVLSVRARKSIGDRRSRACS